MAFTKRTAAGATAATSLALRSARPVLPQPCLEGRLRREHLPQRVVRRALASEDACRRRRRSGERLRLGGNAGRLVRAPKPATRTLK
eukprot:4762168-Prymnesium_polylepis.1